MKYSQLNVLGGVSVLDSKGGQFCMDKHVHEEFVLAAYLYGSKAYECPDHSGLMSQGDFLSISPDVPHSALSLNNVGCRYVAVYPTLMQFAKATGYEAHQIQRRMYGGKPIRSHDGGCQITQELTAALWEKHESDSAFAFSVFLSGLFARFEEAGDITSAIPSNIGKVWDCIYEEPLEKLDLGLLANSAGISKEHLCRAFKANFGLSPFQLLRARRTAHARKLISNGMSLAEASVESGFSDQSHMSRWFQRIYGASPKNVAQYQ
jgi:AraC-like DNA-binding protein